MLQYFIQQSDIGDAIFDRQIVASVEFHYLLNQCPVWIIAQELSESIASTTRILQALPISAPSRLILLISTKMQEI